jgi:hypothetical protein
MDTRTIAGVVLLVVVLLVAVPMLRRRQLEGQCAQLMAERSRRSVQGANQTELEQLDADIRNCQQAARAAGSTIDPSAGELELARSSAQLIGSEWRQYVSTADTDAAKRNDTRDAVLSAERTTVEQARNAVSAATSLDGLRAIQAFLIGQMTDSYAHAACFVAGEHGCSRTGINEPDWDERARDELVTYLIPLGARQAIESGAWAPTPPGTALEWQAAGPRDIFHAARVLYPNDDTLFRLRRLWRIWDENVGQAGTIRLAWQQNTDTVFAALLAKRAQLSGARPLVNVGGFVVTPATLALASSLRTARGGA